MQALCVNANRDLELREIAEPGAPAAGYVNVAIRAAAINHGDKTFLKLPDAAGGMRGLRRENVWGASAAGIVTAIGPGVPPEYLGRKVAIYRSLQADLPFLGLWCQTAQMPFRACLRLPDSVDERDYSGSLVNVVTAWSFLAQIRREGHRGVIVTAPGSATGRALLALAARQQFPVLAIARSATTRAALEAQGVNAVAADDPQFNAQLGQQAAALGASAVFDGVGGELIGRMMPALVPRSVIYCYGFLAGSQPVSFPSALLMMKDTVLRRFSNFDSDTVQDERQLMAMLEDLESCIGDPAFATPFGQPFSLAEADAALAWSTGDGRRAVFLP